MKKLIIPIFLALIVAVSSCKETAYTKITMEQEQQLKDSIPGIFPSASTFHLIQGDDYTKVKIIVSDASFYSAGADAKQAAGAKLGTALLHILGPDNNLSKATLVATKSTNSEDSPADGIDTEIDMDKLNKEVYPSKK